MILNAPKLGKSLRLFQTWRTFSSKFEELRSSQDVVLSSSKNGVYVIGLNGQRNKNAFSNSFINNLCSTLDDLKRNESIKVLIIRSMVKGVFCAGADLKERLEMTNQQVSVFVDKLRWFSCQLSEFPYPTIAAIDGLAVGGGLEVCLACDLRVSSLKARMGLVETNLAIIPGAGGTQRLSRLVGPAKAKELIFTGKVINGKEANRIGLINRLAEDTNIDEPAFEEAQNLAEEIANKSPIALKMAKFAIDKGLEVDLYTGLSFEKACYSQVIPTQDRIEALKAFVEKRKPTFIGK